MNDFYVYKRIDGHVFTSTANPDVIYAYNRLNPTDMPIPICLGKWKWKSPKGLWIKRPEYGIAKTIEGGDILYATIYNNSEIITEIRYNLEKKVLVSGYHMITHRNLPTIQVVEHIINKTIHLIKRKKKLRFNINKPLAKWSVCEMAPSGHGGWIVNRVLKEDMDYGDAKELLNTYRELSSDTWITYEIREFKIK